MSEDPQSPESRGCVARKWSVVDSGQSNVEYRFAGWQRLDVCTGGLGAPLLRPTSTYVDGDPSVLFEKLLNIE